MNRNSTFARIARATAFAAASALAVSAMAPANASANDLAPKAQDEAPVAKEKRYCVVETFTGSMLPRKICKTRAEWIREQNFDPLAKKR